MTRAERIYRILLKAYPRRYRERYEEPMAQLFADQLRAAGTARKRTALWLRTLADFACTLPARHWERPAYGDWSTAARRSVFYARYEASSFGRREISADHLLLGILREGPVLPELAALRQEWVAAVETAEGVPRRKPPKRAVPINFATREILAQAKAEAERAQAPRVTTRHLLAAIVQQPATPAAQWLVRHGISLERLRAGA